MKFASTLLSIIFVSASAHSAQIICDQKKPVGNQINEFASVHLVADLGQDELKNVVVTAVASYDGYGNGMQTSRPGNLKAIPSKKKSKYSHLNRFNLTQLPGEKGGGFSPSQDCAINIFLPKNAIDLQSFEAPSNVHCEQNGGFVPYQCSVTQ